MPLTDADIVRRRLSVSLPSDGVDFTLYAYNDSFFIEKSFQSIHKLLAFFENDRQSKDKYYWIEVINASCLALPTSIEILCRHFGMHSLTVEDITTLASHTKLDLFQRSGALYLLMKLLTWHDQRVLQQQISFYLNCSENLLITFQEKPIERMEPFFQTIQNRLRRQKLQQQEDSPHCRTTRLRHRNVDYLFYCLLDAIIDRYMFVMEEIANRIAHLDNSLMTDSHARTLSVLYSIYRLKHDLLHLRILFNPLKEIIIRLQRTTSDDPPLSFPRTEPLLKLGLKHHIVRRPARTDRLANNSQRRKTKFSSIYLNDYIYVYLHDLSNHVDQLIDCLEIQRESVSILISFWNTLNSNETQEILQILMLITVLFMPCTLVTGMCSTNFYFQALLEYRHGYYIIVSLLATILSGMITWYKVKSWI